MRLIQSHVQPLDVEQAAGLLVLLPFQTHVLIGGAPALVHEQLVFLGKRVGGHQDRDLGQLDLLDLPAKSVSCRLKENVTHRAQKLRSVMLPKNIALRRIRRIPQHFAFARLRPSF